MGERVAEGKRVVEDEKEGEGEVTSKTTIQLSYKSIGVYFEFPIIQAALERTVSPITASMLTLIVLGADKVFSELIEMEDEDAEAEKDRNESFSDRRTGGRGYTSAIFSGVNRRAI